MRVKLFAAKEKGKRSARFEELEAQINTWLESHPNITVERAHRLSQPNLAWGQLAVAVWYSEPSAS